MGDHDILRMEEEKHATSSNFSSMYTNDCQYVYDYPHPTWKVGVDSDDGSSPADAEQINAQEAQKLYMQKSIQILMHTCQCKDANCGLLNCQKMKQVLMHTRNCTRRTYGDCSLCKRLIYLCYYHAKYCQETKCLVLLCSKIKQKIKQQRLYQQQLHQQLQESQLLRRRMPNDDASQCLMNRRLTKPVVIRSYGLQRWSATIALGIMISVFLFYIFFKLYLQFVNSAGM